MPLSFPTKRPNFKINKIKNAILQGLNYLRPDIVLAIFLFFAVVLAFFKNQAIGFYGVFGIFIIGYFAERILIKIKKNKTNG